MRSVIVVPSGLYPRVLYEKAEPETASVNEAVYSSTTIVVVRTPLAAETSVIAWSVAACAAAGAKSASARAPRRDRRCMEGMEGAC